jgi:hypothetical protein
MAEGVNPAAPHVLPFFVPGPDGSDQMMITVGVVLLVIVVALGVIFFWVHSLPERLAHRTKKVQMEFVAVLCLLALFTHVHAFWVGALLLALIDIPTLARPVERIAGSLERLADRGAPDPDIPQAPEQVPPAPPERA